MTVPSESYKNFYTGDGSTDTYAYTFRIIDEAFLVVHQLVSGETEPTPLVLGVDYTVTGAGNVNGGNIVLTAGNLPSSDKLSIRQNPDLTQDLDLVNQGPFFAQDIEDALDKLTMASHRFDDAVVRSLKFSPVTDLSVVDTQLPDPDPGKVFGWNATGDGIINLDPGSVSLAIPASNSVGTAQLQNGSVTTAKLDAGFILPIANGGTASTTAAAARTALGLGTAAVEDVGTAIGEVVVLEDVGGNPALPAVDASQLTGITGLISLSNLVVLQDQKASGTAGGTLTGGAYQTRVLNTEVNDTGGLCTLAANQFTLSAGDYLVFASAQAIAVGDHRLRIQNITGGTTLVEGNNAHSSDKASPAVLLGAFTVAAGQSLELQHRSEGTRSTDGYGQPLSTGAVERYATVLLLKIG